MEEVERKLAEERKRIEEAERKRLEEVQRKLEEERKRIEELRDLEREEENEIFPHDSPYTQEGSAPTHANASVAQTSSNLSLLTLSWILISWGQMLRR